MKICSLARYPDLQRRFLKVKAGIPYMTFASPICSLKESALVGESQSESADFGQPELTNFTENRVVCDGL